MNRVNVFAIHRCINEGYGLIQIVTDKIRISPTKLWRVCTDVVFLASAAHNQIIHVKEVSKRHVAEQLVHVALETLGRTVWHPKELEEPKCDDYGCFIL